MTSAIARMNLFLHGIEDFQIVRGDTLADPKFLEGDRLRQFDVVLANPPYSIKQWDRDAWATDPCGRNLLRHAAAGPRRLRLLPAHPGQPRSPDTGRCAILFPHGVLFREEEQHMRAQLIEADLIECVIGLGPNLFYNSPMEACVVVCRTRKPPERRGQGPVHQRRERGDPRAGAELPGATSTSTGSSARTATFGTWRDLARVATLDEIRANQSNLNIPLYVLSPANGEDIAENEPLAQIIANWEDSAQALRVSMEGLFATLESTILGEM